MARAEHASLAATLALAGALLLAAVPATAGLLLDAPEGGYPEDPAPPPPAFSIDKLVPVALPVNASTLALGVDPATLTMGKDGIVRYVSVISSPSGTYSAIYEGIRCSTGEVKVYARHYSDGNWKPVAEPAWQSLFDQVAGRYSMRIARAGVCHDAAPNGSVQQILLDLRGDTSRTDRRP